MKKLMIFLIILVSFIMMSCQSEPTEDVSVENQDVIMITPEEAKANLEENPEIVLLDVRTPSEYETEHIPEAVLLTLDEIEEKASEIIPNKDKTYYVYCRSGNRSAVAAQLLVDMGYKNIYDLGGIKDWPYETISEK